MYYVFIAMTEITHKHDRLQTSEAGRVQSGNPLALTFYQDNFNSLVWQVNPQNYIAFIAMTAITRTHDIDIKLQKLPKGRVGPPLL